MANNSAGTKLGAASRRTLLLYAVVQPSGNPEACQQGGDQRKAARISGGQPLRPDPHREDREQHRNLPDEYVERMAAQKCHGAEGEDAWKPGDQKPERRDRTHKIHDADRSQPADVDERFRERRHSGYEPVMVGPEKTAGQQADGKEHSSESLDRR